MSGRRPRPGSNRSPSPASMDSRWRSPGCGKASAGLDETITRTFTIRTTTVSADAAEQHDRMPVILPVHRA